MAGGIVVCEGAPRDLGLDQGRARADDVVRLAKQLRGEGRRFAALRNRGALRGSRAWRQVARDLRRFYPHLHERTQGLQRGARVARRDLMVLLARELGDAGDGILRLAGGTGLGVVPERAAGVARLGRTFDFPRGLSPRPFLRRSEPEGGYASLEVALPAFATGLAGVNEHGLAVASTTIPSKPDHRSDCAAPAFLLVQECLQRFDAVEPAVEWCRKRPSGGRASILLADVTGELASVRIEGGKRSVRGPSEGRITGVGRRQTLIELDKACREAGALDGARLRAILASHGDDGRPDENTPCRHGELRSTQGCVVIDPRARQIELVVGAPCSANAEIERAAL